MATEHLKRASRTPTTGEDETRTRVAQMLGEIREGREDAVRRMARELDGWEGEIVVAPEQVRAARRLLSPELVADLELAHAHVREFARHQRASMHEFEVELAPGSWAGQRLIPVATAGCYVPGGRYAHVASALMSVTTARVAGVERVIACSPPRGPEGIHPAVLCALDLAGVDTVLAVGGVQAIGALAFGLFDCPPADVLVGPGNRFVAEAKRLLFGEVGIDLFAGPTEILVIADGSADPELVACDLVGQAEHGADSPAWLVTTSRALAEHVLEAVPRLCAALPEPARRAAENAWRDYGEVVLVSTREEAVAVSDGYAPEHLEVHAADRPFWLERLRNYGALFLGEETTVAYGDKCSGPNHILPTRGAARYTGGLGPAKFVKIVTYQHMTPAAAADMGKVAARISRLEGMEAHARTGDERERRYAGSEA